MPKEKDSTLMDEDRLSPIDVYVGLRIRLRRKVLGVSQEWLGDALGLTFQQVQKYERGVNRVGASRLFEIACIMDMPVSYFFDDMPEGMSEIPLSGRRGRMSGGNEWHEKLRVFADENIVERETRDLVAFYYRIADQTMRQRIFDLIKSLAPLVME